MAKTNRTPKTVGRKVRDLDDHLYFLKESLAKLGAGDEAYLKPLAAELRVLVCKSSGTEGLLWRVLRQLNMPDDVHVHLAGNLNRDHPLAVGLQFHYTPIVPAGQGDDRLAPDHYSLQEIIQECEAIWVSGVGYTHASLISAIAQQMGTAHEDEGVAPHLVELSRTLISGQVALVDVLASDAQLVLEVGERTIAACVAQGTLVRPRRPDIVIPRRSRRAFPLPEINAEFQASPPTLHPEGTMIFQVNHADIDWRTNANGYNFGDLSQGPVTCNVAKYPDRTVEVWVHGLGSGIAGVICPLLPRQGPQGMMVGITWSAREIIFYLENYRVTKLPF